MGDKMKEVSLIKYYEKPGSDYHYNIYVLKTGDVIVYIGRSQDIYQRWFSVRGHLRRVGRWFKGDGSVGSMVANNPNWNWRLQLWTVTEAAKFCGYKLIKGQEPLIHLDRIESAMIDK